MLFRLIQLSARSAPPGLVAASLRSAEFGRAADAAQARASPASLTDGGDAVGTSRASARRTSSPVVGIFRRFAARDAPPGLLPGCRPFRGFAPLRGASPPANQGTPLRGFLSRLASPGVFARRRGHRRARRCWRGLSLWSASSMGKKRRVSQRGGRRAQRRLASQVKGWCRPYLAAPALNS